MRGTRKFTSIFLGDWTRRGTFVTVTCPGCEEPIHLNHVVDEDGTVEPAVRCTRCVFSGWIKLERWRNGRIKTRNGET